MILHAERILTVAKAKIGMKEDPIGSNRGPDLSRFMNCVGFQDGDAWCYFFCSACYYHALWPEIYDFGWIKATGSCQMAVAYARSQGCVSPYPTTGGIAILLNSEGHAFHAGIVESTDVSQGLYTAIEGNTNDDGSHEGYEVCRHTRSLEGKLFIYPKELVPGERNG